MKEVAVQVARHHGISPKLCYPEAANKYWVTRIVYECKDCGLTFEEIIPNGYDLMELVEQGGKRVRWLPVWGRGGYIDLMGKFIPGHRQNDEITMAKVKIFIKELEKYSEKGEMGRGYEIAHEKHRCKNCNSRNLYLREEIVIENPKLNWLKISCQLL